MRRHEERETTITRKIYTKKKRESGGTKNYFLAVSLAALISGASVLSGSARLKNGF